MLAGRIDRMWEGVPSPPTEGSGTGLARYPEKNDFYMKWYGLVYFN